MRRLDKTERDVLGESPAKSGAVQADGHKIRGARDRLKNAGGKERDTGIPNAYPRRLGTLVVYLECVPQIGADPYRSEIMHGLIADDDRIERRVPHDRGSGIC